jgi:hypothetical protein
MHQTGGGGDGGAEDVGTEDTDPPTPYVGYFVDEQ